MMPPPVSVDNADVIDLVGVDQHTGHAVLTVSDHLAWDSDEHLLTLQDKLNAYLRFIESGDLVRRYPEAKDRVPQITVVLKYPPSGNGLRFLERVSRVIESGGILFRHETLPH